MYITVIDIIEEKRINLFYPIRNFNSVVSMISDKVQYLLKDRAKVQLKMGEFKELTKGVYGRGTR